MTEVARPALRVSAWAHTLWRHSGRALARPGTYEHPRPTWARRHRRGGPWTTLSPCSWVPDLALRALVRNDRSGKASASRERLGAYIVASFRASPCEARNL